jgi:Zn-dependent M32 family carboxypeptidase
VFNESSNAFDQKKTKDFENPENKNKILGKLMSAMSKGKIEDLFEKIGVRKSTTVISRLNSLKQKDQLKKKFEDLWENISKIHKNNDEELENLRVRESNKMKKRRSIPKQKLKSLGKESYSIKSQVISVLYMRNKF